MRHEAPVSTGTAGVAAADGEAVPGVVVLGGQPISKEPAKVHATQAERRTIRCPCIR